jgi:hypothetical protein
VTSPPASALPASALPASSLPATGVPVAPVPDLRGFPGLGRTRVMGVVNASPDSFAGGFAEARDAVRHGLRLLEAGADLLDVGGESTRPGAERVSAAEELRRVVPVVRGLTAAGAVVSVDTTRAAVALAALEAGARLVNDVSGGLADPAMLPAVAEAEVAYVAMHWRGHSADMQRRASYADVVADVCSELSARRGRRPPRGSTCSGCCWTPASGSPRRPTTTGRCCAASLRWPPWGSRCSSARPARASSGRCSPGAASRGRPRSATRPAPP